MNRRVLVFGGAFNPPTVAHEAIVRACLGLSDFDQVWVMPSGERLDKSMEASDADRLRLLEVVKTQVFANDPRLVISNFELRLPRPTKTASTVPALQAAYPDTEFWFVYGADSYRSMSQWPDGERLQQLLKVVLFARSPEHVVPGRECIALALPDISSTRVRQAVKNHETLEGLVSEPVARYIERHRLYV